MKTVGLYLHIPFCKFLCHYCDFVKTAHWTDELAKEYFSALERHLHHAIQNFLIPEGYLIKSVFIGGGTPSLFAKEYETLLACMRPYFTKDIEVTLEANPDNVSRENLSAWKKAGFNRFSMGVQSFCSKGLRTLTRQHEISQTITAYEQAREFFNSINLDLIYGWKDQDLSLWKKDLEELIRLDPDHVSLYLLTYASKTPMGRAYERGKIASQRDEDLEGFYKVAREELGKAGYCHEEVSNWSKRGKHCVHNWLYWEDEPYLAVGAGACGYLPSKTSSLGFRYQYTSRERGFCKQNLPPLPTELSRLEGFSDKNFLIEERSPSIWLLEYIGASLRSSKGVDLERIEKKIKYKFTPSILLKKAAAQKLLAYKGGRVILSEKEWFRESAWCLELFECFSFDASAAL